MFNITRRDIAWGTGIASVVTALAFFSIINSMVSSTSNAVVDGKQDLERFAHGVIATGIVPTKVQAIVYIAEDDIVSGPMSLAQAQAEAKSYAAADAVVFLEGSRAYAEALTRLQPSVQIAARWPRK